VPEAKAVLDIGALHTRAMQIDERSRGLNSKMTSQCAAGTGQFLENIARYLGIRQDEIGPLSIEASPAEACSGICAVLSETDVINLGQVQTGQAAGGEEGGVERTVSDSHDKNAPANVRSPVLRLRRRARGTIPDRAARRQQTPARLLHDGPHI